MSKSVRRLYNSFQPERYELSLYPNRDNMTFSGKVLIEGRQVNRPSNRLTFHQKDLHISSAEIVRSDKKGELSIKVVRTNLHKKFDEVRLHTEQPLYPGRYKVTMTFSGKITEPMNGIYPSFFKEDGKKHTIIVTQFESHHAREAFPCIDEPEAKAVFDLTLTSPANETVLSNTPVISQTTKNNLLVTTFQTTPKMSTYLLAFVFGKLDFKEQKTNDGVVVRTYSTPGNLKYTKFCLDTAVKCLEFYNDYFNIDYPLEKCDFVALPDFAAGAMENWGLITCREQAMLVDSKNTSLYIKQHVALVIAHELAHQWFGNLVTMKWWSDLWLNEGFASWIEHLALDKLFPQWQAWTQFAIDDSAPAFRLDALANSHPVKAIINNPDEIRSIFDSISYSKGSSLINMLHNYLGPELFIKGLRSYLKTYAYSNADTDDLWKALEKESKLPVFDFMNTWTSQIGFPMVFATVKPTQLYLKQERFLLNPISRKSYTNDVKWPIPLLIDQNNHELFDSKEQTKKIVTTKALKLNTGQTGFYRVKYDSDHLEKLSQEIRDNKLSPLDRLGLISDIFESAKAGFSTTNEALKLISNFSQEEDYVVWTIIATNLSSLRSVMNDSSVRKLIKPYTRSLISLQLKRLGWEEKSHESHLDKLLRTVILGLAAAADEPSVLKRIKEEFNSSITSDDISPDLRSIVYPTIARKGSVREFNKMLKIYKESDSSEVRVTLTAALTNFQQSALIIRALDLIISDEVRLQDVFYWIAYGFGNRHAKTAMWEWTIDHWEWLKKNLGDDISFYRLPLYCASAFSDISFLPTYRKFFNKVSTPALSSSIKQGVEVIQWQSAWKKRDLSDIKKYFAQSS